MSESTANGPGYGNWVSAKLVWAPGVLGLVCLLLALWVPWVAILAVVFIACAVYFAYARHAFSPQGKDLQAKIQALLLEQFACDGIASVIDIGCGSGAIAIEIAKRCPRLKVVAVDTWGQAWEYSKHLCERNAALEHVADRVVFQQASASSLPFADGSFDAAVSNLAFHEAADSKDKRLLVQEALRVVRKGGSFVFQDLFLWKLPYGEIESLLDAVRGWGVERVELISTSEAPFIPRLLKLPFMIGTIGILRGIK